MCHANLNVRELVLADAGLQRLPGSRCQHAGKETEQVAHIQGLRVPFHTFHVSVNHGQPHLAVVDAQIVV